MKNFQNLIVTFPLFFNMLSCTSNHNDLQKIDFPKTITLNILEAITDSINISDIAEKIEYIPLQTKSNVLLGNISSFFVTKEDFFIQTEDSGMVYRYDREGLFLNRMFKVGRGPGEVRPNYFTVDNTKKQLYVLTYPSGVYVYNYEGNFIKKIFITKVDKVDFTVSIGSFNNTFFYAQMPDPKIKFVYYCQDLNNDSIKFLYRNHNNYGKYDKKIRPKLYSLNDFNYQITDSSIFFKEKFSDTIFGLNKSFIAEPRYIIDLGNQKMRWEDYRDIFVFHEGPITPQFKYPNGYWIESNTETKSFLFSVIRSPDNPQIFSIYNKNTSSIKISKRKSYNYENEQIFIKNDLA